jgi:hypothetical protein
MSPGLWALLIASSTAAATAAAWAVARVMRRARDRGGLVQAMYQFHGQREYAEAKFVDLAAHSGKPRGLVWVRCDFDDDVSYVRDKSTGQISALVGVTIGFAAEEGGAMADVEAVGNLRAATAVFHYAGKQWMTQGRTLFNLSPTEAISRYQERFEIVAEETAGTA